MKQRPILMPGSLEAAVDNANLDLAPKDLTSAAKEADKVEKEEEEEAKETKASEGSKSTSKK